MADSVRKVRYVYAMVPNRPGQGARLLAELRKHGVNLQAYSGFPGRRGRAQIDLVTRDLAGVRRAASRNGWRLSGVKRAFVIQGSDRIGAVHHHLARLSERKINVVAADAVAAGNGRYGMLLWVKAKDYARAANALGAR